MASSFTTGSRFTAGQGRYQMLDVQLDQHKLNAVLASIRHVPNALSRVIPPMLNKAANEEKTLLYREFLTRLNIARKTSVKKRLERTPKATRVSFAAGVRISLSRFTVASFKGTRWLKRQGVRWSPQPGRTEMIPRAFVRQGLTHYKTKERMDNRQVWRRKGRGDGTLVGRYPIQVLRGPSMGYVFDKDAGFKRAMEVQGERIVMKKAKQQVDRLLAKVPK